MGQLHFDPASYGAEIRALLSSFEAIQGQVAEATRGIVARRIIDLGIGTGETAKPVLAEHPEAELVGIDSSPGMLAGVDDLLGKGRAELLCQNLEDPLPAGPFDLAISAFAIHHLPGPEKADLFKRLAAVLTRPGRLVFADVVVPQERLAVPIKLDPERDNPSTLADQIEWLAAAGFTTEVRYAEDDLAVVVAEL